MKTQGVFMTERVVNACAFTSEKACGFLRRIHERKPRPHGLAPTLGELSWKREAVS